jgi:hypothetical protein
MDHGYAEYSLSVRPAGSTAQSMEMFSSRVTLFFRVIRRSPIAALCGRIVPSRPASLPMPWEWRTAAPGCFISPRERYATLSITRLPLCCAPNTPDSTPIHRVQRKLRPHRRAAVVVAYAPAPGQMGDDRQAAAAERRKRGARGTRPGDRAAVADAYFEHVRSENPADPHMPVRQWMRVPQRVAQQFAHDQGGIVRGGLTDARAAKLGGQPAACHSDAGGRVREQNRARRPHLHQRPPSPVGSRDPHGSDTSGNAPRDRSGNRVTQMVWK